MARAQQKVAGRRKTVTKKRAGAKPRPARKLKSREQRGNSLVDEWCNEVRQVLASRARTTSEAAERIVELTMVRMKVPAARRNEVREFLLRLFGEDPVLQAELQKLTVRGRGQ